MELDAATTWLDWAAGVVVPLLLGTLTLFVALWAASIARKSNALAERIHGESRAENARRLRIPFGGALSELTGSVLSARLAGTNAALEMIEPDRLQRVTRLQAEADDSTGKLLFAWSTTVASKAPMEQNLDSWLQLFGRTNAMIELWISNPADAVAAIERDEEYKSFRP